MKVFSSKRQAGPSRHNSQRKVLAAHLQAGANETVRRRWKLSFLALFTVLLIIAGTSAASYPTIANWFSEYASSKVLKNYVKEEKHVVPSYVEQLAQAHAYNDALDAGAIVLKAGDRKPSSSGGESGSGLDYDKMLSADDEGTMGWLTIPKIHVNLPIYHGTSDAVLEKGVGHLEGTSLPVGGPSTRAVLSAHRGLAKATLFTHLDKVGVGDRFTVNVLGETMTYQVITTQVVDPSDTEALRIERGKDLVTLVTCTPLGINTSRILVTGQRVYPTPKADIAAAKQAPRIPPFPWWAVWMSATVAVSAVYVWRMGYAPSPAPAKKHETARRG